MEDNNDSRQQNNLPEDNNQDEEERKKNRKKMFIIIGIAVALVIVLIIILLLLLTLCRNRDLDENETVDITQETEITQEEPAATETTQIPETTSSGTSATTAEETTSSEETTAETEETPAEEETEAPTLSLSIDEGPVFSPADEVCFYRIKATVTGIPKPDLTWNIDDSLGSYLPYKVQVNINNPSQTRTLEATATNSAGTVKKTITLSWGCNRPPEIQEITLMGDHYINTEYTVSASATDPDGDILKYQWSVTGGSIYDEDVNPMEWKTPAIPGFYNITVTVDDGKGGTDSMTETVEVREPNKPPVVGSITITELKLGKIPLYIYVNRDYEVSVEASDPDGDSLSYNWTATGGSITKGNQNPAEWKAPSYPGFYTISVTVNDGKGGTATNGIYVQVREIVY